MRGHRGDPYVGRARGSIARAGKATELFVWAEPYKRTGAQVQAGSAFAASQASPAAPAGSRRLGEGCCLGPAVTSSTRVPARVRSYWSRTTWASYTSLHAQPSPRRPGLWSCLRPRLCSTADWLCSRQLRCVMRLALAAAALGAAAAKSPTGPINLTLYRVSPLAYPVCAPVPPLRSAALRRGGEPLPTPDAEPLAFASRAPKANVPRCR